MSAQDNSTNADTDGPDYYGKSENDVDWVDQAQDGSDHDGPRGVAGREAELVHHLHGSKLIIHIVSWPAPSCEGFENSHDNNVKNQSKKQVEEEGRTVGVETSNGNKQPGNT